MFLLVEDESKLIKLKETEFQNTLLSVGLGSAILGSSGGPWVAETLGRKISIICADILFVIGLAMFSMAPATEMLVLGRVCVGIGMGLLTVMTPQLLGEISTAPIRGSLTSLNGLFFGLGYLSSSIFSVLLLKVGNRNTQVPAATFKSLNLISRYYFALKFYLTPVLLQCF